MVVNSDHSPLNLSLTGAPCRQSPDSKRDVTDQNSEETRRRKAELMTSLRLFDCSTSGRRAESPPTPEVETSTDWNGNHLLYEPPPSKRPRTDNEEDEEEDVEEASKKGRSSLLSVLTACSFTDVYNAYQRRQARLQPDVNSSAGIEADCIAGSGLTAEVVDTTPGADRKSLSPTSDSGVVPPESGLTNVAPSTDNGVYPLAARYALQNRTAACIIYSLIHPSHETEKLGGMRSSCFFGL